MAKRSLKSARGAGTRSRPAAPAKSLALKASVEEGADLVKAFVTIRNDGVRQALVAIATALAEKARAG